MIGRPGLGDLLDLPPLPSVNLKYLQAGFAIASVFVSWIIIPTLYMLRYAPLLLRSGWGSTSMKPAPGNIAISRAFPSQLHDVRDH